MPLLPNLAKRIDSFYKMAEQYRLMSLGALNDKELYSELERAAKEVINPEVSYTLQILSDMYRKALEINGGFNTLYLTIQGISEDLDPEEEELDNVENLLMQISNSIKSRAARSDSPGAMRELQMAASEAKRRLAEQAPDVPEEDDRDEGEMSAYEASVLGYGGAQQAFEEEGGVAKFDPTGGVSPEAAQSGKGRGYSVGKAHTYKDWANIYAAEKAKYQQDLSGPSNMLTGAVRTARENAAVKFNLNSLIDTLDQLENLTKEIVGLETKISLETEVEHPKEQARIDEIRTELETLGKKRESLKRNISRFYKKFEQENLEKQVSNVSGTEKLILDLKIKLQKLRLSNAYGYGKEAEAIKKLIDSLIADPNLSQEQIRKHLAGIARGEKFKDKVTYDREKTLEKAKLKGVKEPHLTRKDIQERGVRAPRSGLGMGVIHDYKLSEVALEGLVVHLTQRLATERVVVKQKVTDKLKKLQKDPAGLKPIMDDIAKAATKKDRAAVLEHTKRLRSKMEEFKQVQPELIQYVISLRSSKFLYQFRDQIKKIPDLLKDPNISTEQKETFIFDAIAMGTKLSEYYKSLKIKPITPGWAERGTHYKPPVEIIEQMVNNLKKMVG